MEKKSVKILLLACFISLFSCKGIYEDGTDIVSDMGNQIPNISVDQLKQKIDKGEDFLLLDVRQPNEYYTNNIPGSVLLPRGVLEFKIDDFDFWASQYIYPPTDSTEIVIYCKSGGRGTLAAKSLMQLGYKNVKNLKGGYNAFNPNQDPNAQPKKPSGGCGG